MGCSSTAVAAAAVCLLAFEPELASAGCYTALSLGIDVSKSIDSEEHAAQRSGTAEALLHDSVWQRLIGNKIHVFEWSSPMPEAPTPEVIVPWTEIRSFADVEAVAEMLLSKPRSSESGATYLSNAVLFGVSELEKQPDCYRHVLDISGDGVDNGPMKSRMEFTEIPEHVTLNAIVVGEQHEWYYRTKIARGPSSFSVPAEDWSDYYRALVLKLQMELS